MFFYFKIFKINNSIIATDIWSECMLNIHASNNTTKIECEQIKVKKKYFL